MVVLRASDVVPVKSLDATETRYYTTLVSTIGAILNSVVYCGDETGHDGGRILGQKAFVSDGLLNSP